MLNEQEARKIAEPIVANIVNSMSKNDYESIVGTVINCEDDLDSIKNWVDSFLEMNDLDGVDSYDVECKFSTNYEYHQLNCYIYDDGNGFAIDYDLTTDGELNDMILQLDFKKQQNGSFRILIKGIDVM